MKRKIHQLVIIPDAGLESIYHKNGGALVCFLCVVLKEGTIPLLVSGSVLQRFLLLLTINLEQNTEGDTRFFKNQETFRFQQELFRTTNFCFSKWLVFKLRCADQYVFIPRTLCTQTATDSNDKRYTVRELKLGIKIDHREQVEEVSNLSELTQHISNDWQNLLTQLNSHVYFPFSKVNIKEMQRLFITRDSVARNTTSLIGSWVILQYGHGVNHPLKSLMSGLSKNAFQEMLQFYINKLDCFFFYSWTCSGGGFHAEEVNKFLLQQDRNSLINGFIVATGSISDNTTWESPDIEIKRFFDLIKKMLSSESSEDIKSLLITALAYLTPSVPHSDDFNGVASIPLVRVPGMRKFCVADIEGKVAVFCRSMKPTNHLINKYYDGDYIRNKQVYCLYSSVSFIYIDGQLPTIVSMVPINNYIHQIDLMSAESVTFADLLSHSFFNLKEVSTKFFVVSKLICNGIYDDDYTPVPNLAKAKSITLFNIIIKKSFRRSRLFGIIPGLGFRTRSVGTVYYDEYAKQGKVLRSYKLVIAEPDKNKDELVNRYVINSVEINLNKANRIKKRMQYKLGKQQHFEYEPWKGQLESYVEVKRQPI